MGLINLNSLRNIFSTKVRYLTIGEKELAHDVFGDALNVNNIQIVAHRMVLQGYAISPNGSIYFNPKDWCEDFSLRNIHEQSWLIHELTHVWQIQQGIAVVRKAIMNRRYSYVLKAGKAFMDYGVEQQAQMVQDYFIKSKKGEQCSAYEACIPFLKNLSSN